MIIEQYFTCPHSFHFLERKISFSQINFGTVYSFKTLQNLKIFNTIYCQGRCTFMLIVWQFFYFSSYDSLAHSVPRGLDGRRTVLLDIDPWCTATTTVGHRREGNERGDDQRAFVPTRRRGESSDDAVEGSLRDARWIRIGEVPLARRGRSVAFIRESDRQSTSARSLTVSIVTIVVISRIFISNRGFSFANNRRLPCTYLDFMINLSIVTRRGWD